MAPPNLSHLQPTSAWQEPPAGIYSHAKRTRLCCATHDPQQFHNAAPQGVTFLCGISSATHAQPHLTGTRIQCNKQQTTKTNKQTNKQASKQASKQTNKQTTTTINQPTNQPINQSINQSNKQTTNNKPQTTNNKQQTTNNKQQAPVGAWYGSFGGRRHTDHRGSELLSPITVLPQPVTGHPCLWRSDGRRCPCR